MDHAGGGTLDGEGGVGEREHAGLAAGVADEDADRELKRAADVQLRHGDEIELTVVDLGGRGDTGVVTELVGVGYGDEEGLSRGRDPGGGPDGVRFRPVAEEGVPAGAQVGGEAAAGEAVETAGDLGVEAEANGVEETVAGGDAGVDLTDAAVAHDVQGVFDRAVDAEVATEAVARTAGDQAEGGGCADDAAADFVEGTVAADGDDAWDAARGGVARELGGVVGALGGAEFGVETKRGDAGAQIDEELRAPAVEAGVRVEDEAELRHAAGEGRELGAARGRSEANVRCRVQIPGDAGPRVFRANKCVAGRAGMTQTPALDPLLPYRMAFNLQKVLRALLFASSGPLTIKEIQDTLTRFHAQEADLLAKMKPEAPTGEPAAEVSAEPQPAVEGAEPGETPAEPVAVVEGMPVVEGVLGTESSMPVDAAADVPLGLSAAETDPEYYQEVPSLITATQIREAMDAIAADLKARDEVFYLIEGSNGYRLVTNPKAARWVRLLRDEPPPVRLSQAALETLAVIAYRQPVTRGEIETIRGVSAEAGVNKLLERGLIYVAGRAELPGRPIQFGTTDEFLEFVGIKSLAELPASDVLSNRQIDEWLSQAQNQEAVGDKEVGLETGELPLDPAEEPVEELSAAKSEPAAESAPAVTEPAEASESAPALAVPEPPAEPPAMEEPAPENPLAN